MKRACIPDIIVPDSPCIATDRHGTPNWKQNNISNVKIRIDCHFDCVCGSMNAVTFKTKIMGAHENIQF